MIQKKVEKTYRKHNFIHYERLKESLKWWLALIFTVILGYFDYEAMNNLFFDGGIIKIQEARIYALIYAMCLEGIPFFGGSFAAMLLVRTHYKKNDKMYARIGCIVAALGMVMAFGMAWYLRDVQIRAKGGIDKYEESMIDEEYGEEISAYPQFISDSFLRISPFITSVVAFLASWKVQKKDTEDDLEIKMKRAYDEYLYREALFMEVWQQLQNTREALWSSVTQYERIGEYAGLSSEVLIPEDADCFREECYRRFRARLISNCISVYPTQIKRYQGAVESRFGVYLLKMCKYSTIPEIIGQIDIAEVIEEYDKKEKEPWEFSKAQAKLEDEFRRLIDNSTIVAQGYIEKGKEETV